MKKIIGLLIVGCLVAIATISFVRNNIDETEAFAGEQMGTDMAANPANEGIGHGDRAPNFTLTTLDGEEVTLSDYQGKKVVLNFWATWCPPCKAEMPHMQNYYEDMAEQENVEILAVNLTSSDVGIEKVELFKEDYGLSFPIPLDEEGDVGKTYQAITIPTTYMIDTTGTIQNKIVGPMDEQMLTDYVSNLK
ncbi:redoxin domain-containing protein [Psychrobacillus soli]|uniref:Redoxin domain-containing protein n=1 Tax=Psychrobacillus soli TaxID=1543965 RepID=A0A544TJH7_9BACI|nr:redoxin domain-containing protein [Psychrobacillus soli]TQR17614.1 redoxin domain-containing protein [Psychrobacillus soli]